LATPDDLYQKLVRVRLQWMRRTAIFGEAIIPNPILRRFAEVKPDSVDRAQQFVDGLPKTLSADVYGAAPPPYDSAARD